MKLGRLHIAGPEAWPDHVLSVDVADLIVGTATQVGNVVLGFEVHRGIALHHDVPGNPWVGVYLGLWAFEFYLDRSGDLEEAYS